LWLLLEILAVLSPADLGVAGVEVIIHPSGKVSNIQEKQLTTLGQIKALEVDGVFDDCQDMVKRHS
jgi:threonine synthase